MIFLIIHSVIAIEYLSLFGTSELPGFYYAEILIGSQESVRKVMIDIGSDLLTITCTGCNDCGSSPNPSYNFTESLSSKVISNIQTSDYKLIYSNKSKLKGFFIEDLVKFESKNDKFIQFKTIIGCNTFESGIFKKPFVDGILGLSLDLKWFNIAKSIFRQDVSLQNVYSVCIGSFDGFIAFGGIDEEGNDGEVVWQVAGNVPQVYADQVKMFNKVIGLNETFLISSTNTLTYLRKQLFGEFLNCFQEFCNGRGNCKGKSRIVEDFSGFCFENNLFDYSTFPCIELWLNSSKIEFVPENYMIKAHSRSSVIFCVGILQNTLKDENTLGSNFMRSKHIYFDIENSKIGFAKSECDYSYNVSEIDYFLNEINVQTELELAENVVIFYFGIAIIYFIILVMFLLLKKLIAYR